MHFQLGKLRLELAIKEYKAHVNRQGKTPSGIIASACIRTPTGKWHLSDGTRTVAIVSPRKRVTLVEPPTEAT
jgi:hypothetical protein